LTEVVRELVVGVGHALGCLCGSVSGLGGSGDGMKRNWLVLGVSNLMEMNVGDLLVGKVGGVVRGSITGQLGEVL